MNARMAHLLTCLYPRAWRKRYASEFEALLLAGRTDAMTVANIVWAALLERVFPSTGGESSPEYPDTAFASWCNRAPWLMFTLLPLLSLAAAYFIACFVLWSGWQIFLPDTITPFVRVDGWAILYFGAGRWLYYGAPVLIGWSIVIMAVRNRITTAWPRIGLAFVGILGGAAQVQTSRPMPGAAGRVSMNLALGENLAHTFVILAVTVIPWTVWRLYQRASLRA